MLFLVHISVFGHGRHAPLLTSNDVKPLPLELMQSLADRRPQGLASRCRV